MDADKALPAHGLVSPSPLEVARRVRAAFAYAGLDVTKPVEGLDIDPWTMQRIADPINPRGARSERELREIARVTGAPAGFLLAGFMAEGGNGANPIAASGHDARRMPAADLADSNAQSWSALEAASTARSRVSASEATHDAEAAEINSPVPPERRPQRQPRRRRQRRGLWRLRRQRRAWWE